MSEQTKRGSVSSLRQQPLTLTNKMMEVLTEKQSKLTLRTRKTPCQEMVQSVPEGLGLAMALL